MASVSKKITKGASFYGKTDAYGDLDFVKKHGVISCGSGDDHVLSHDEWDMVKAADGSEDIELPAGPLKTKRAKRRKKAS